MRPLIVLLLCVTCSTTWARPQADIHRLSSTLGTHFEKISVSIFPISDQRRIKGRVSPPESESRIWTEFIHQLRLYHNLKVKTPAPTQEFLGVRLRSTLSYQKAMKHMHMGQRAFNDVRLKDAADHLGAALDILFGLRYHWVAPTDVARILLMRGQAFLEAKKIADAELSFRRALEVDPGIRMREGFDHPDTVSVFERVRIRSMNRALRSELVLNVTPDTRNFYAFTGYSIHGRLTDQTLEIRIESPRGVLQERIHRTEDPVSDGQRLASRVHAGLPFGRVLHETLLASLHIDAGFEGSTHLVSPVGVFAHYGLRSQIGLLIGNRVYFTSDIAMSVSARDFHEHLRESITSVRLHLGGGTQLRAGPFRGTVILGVQADRMSAITITNSAACKYFRPDDQVPRDLCDFDRDIDRTSPSWSVGPAITLEGRLPIFGQIEFFTQMRVASYLLKTEEHGLDWPVSGALGLGYRLP